MDDKEKIQSFGELVSATERMSKPWQDTVKHLIWAIIGTNLFWAVIVAMLVYFAYMPPAEMSQEQDLTTQHQTQSYIEGATNGN